MYICIYIYIYIMYVYTCICIYMRGWCHAGHAWPAAPPGSAPSLSVPSPASRDWYLLPNNRRQHRTLHIQKDVLPYALC